MDVSKPLEYTPFDLICMRKLWNSDKMVYEIVISGILYTLKNVVLQNIRK